MPGAPGRPRCATQRARGAGRLRATANKSRGMAPSRGRERRREAAGRGAACREPRSEGQGQGASLATLVRDFASLTRTGSAVGEDPAVSAGALEGPRGALLGQERLACRLPCTAGTRSLLSAHARAPCGRVRARPPAQPSRRREAPRSRSQRSQSREPHGSPVGHRRVTWASRASQSCPHGQAVRLASVSVSRVRSTVLPHLPGISVITTSARAHT